MTGHRPDPPAPDPSPQVEGDAPRRRGRRADGAREAPMVPDAQFGSYYGQPVLKPPAWEWMVPAYLFAGGLSAGSAVLAAGADLVGRARLRRSGRLAALAALLASVAFLIADLGRPARFHHMLRVAKPTSPMSVGTWILTAFAPGVGAAAISELVPARWQRTRLGRLLHRLARPAGLSSVLVAPGLASYTAVLLSHTAVPAWNQARGQLPFVFTGSAAASAGGVGMMCTPVAETAPARWFAVYGAVTELATSRLLRHRLAEPREAYTTGRANQLGKLSEGLTAAGLLGTLLAPRGNRTVAVASGLALVTGSALQRFSVFEAGVASTKDPKYVVAGQRRRQAQDLQADQPRQNPT